MADQVHRRERLKRRQAFVWRSTWRARLASPGAARAALPRLPPASPQRPQVRALPRPSPGRPAAPAAQRHRAGVLVRVGLPGGKRGMCCCARRRACQDTSCAARAAASSSSKRDTVRGPGCRGGSSPLRPARALTPRARAPQQAAGADAAPAQQPHAQAAPAGAGAGPALAPAQLPSCAAAAAAAGAAAAVGRPCRSPARAPRPERAGAHAGRAAAQSPAQHPCHWCGGGGGGAALACAACGRRFCFRCYQRRAGYGVQGWARAAREPAYRCPVCTGEPAAPGAPAGRARICFTGLVHGQRHALSGRALQAPSTDWHACRPRAERLPCLQNGGPCVMVVRVGSCFASRASLCPDAPMLGAGEEASCLGAGARGDAGRLSPGRGGRARGRAPGPRCGSGRGRACGGGGGGGTGDPVADAGPDCLRRPPAGALRGRGSARGRGRHGRGARVRGARGSPFARPAGAAAALPAPGAAAPAAALASAQAAAAVEAGAPARTRTPRHVLAAAAAAISRLFAANSGRPDEPAAPAAAAPDLPVLALTAPVQAQPRAAPAPERAAEPDAAHCGAGAGPSAVAWVQGGGIGLVARGEAAAPASAAAGAPARAQGAARRSAPARGREQQQQQGRASPDRNSGHASAGARLHSSSLCHERGDGARAAEAADAHARRAAARAAAPHARSEPGADGAGATGAAAAGARAAKRARLQAPPAGGAEASAPHRGALGSCAATTAAGVSGAPGVLSQDAGAALGPESARAVPVPGMRRVVGAVSGRPQYVAACAHGEARLDRRSRVAAFLQAHARCRCGASPQRSARLSLVHSQGKCLCVCLFTWTGKNCKVAGGKAVVLARAVRRRSRVSNRESCVDCQPCRAAWRAGGGAR